MSVTGKNLFLKDIQVLDVVETMGRQYQVGKVLSCDTYNDFYDESQSYWDCKFFDTSGRYHHWKSYLDGGRVIYFDDGDRFFDLDFPHEVRIKIQLNARKCLNVLKEHNIFWTKDILYFKIDGNIATLYDNGEDMGFVDLCGDDDLEFKKLLIKVTDSCKDCKYYFFPNKFSRFSHMFCEETAGVSNLIKLRR